MNFEETKEKEILEMFESRNINLRKLNNLLDEVDLNKCDYDDYFRYSLLSRCIQNIFNEAINVDWLEVFKLFKEKGLNLDFFGNTLIGDLRFAITPADNLNRVAEYILDNKKYIGDVDPIIDGLIVYNTIGACILIEDEKLWKRQIELYNFVVDYLKQAKSLDKERWNPIIVKDYKLLLKKLEDFDIKGKKIKDIRALGCCYNYAYDRIEDIAYNILNSEGNPEYEKLSEFKNIPSDIQYSRLIEVDEPVIITFDDGTQLEIEFSYPPDEVKISKNKIGKFDIFNTNYPNIDLNILFSNCLNETLEDIIVELTTDSTYFGIPIKKQDIYMKNIIFKLTNGLSIVFTIWADFGVVSVKQYEEYSKIEFKDLKKGIIHNNYNSRLKKYDLTTDTFINN